MRKYLGVVAVLAALCVMALAQAPTQTPASDSAQAPPSGAQAAPDAARAPKAPPQTPASDQEPASIPAPGKPKAPTFPRTELFGGYSFAQAGFFNAGHWAQLNGWDASLTLNGASWIGFVVDGGQYFGNTKIPGTAPAPFPTTQSPYCAGPACTFNADTREYNLLFGVQFTRRKYYRWTPFGELMFGHDGVRGRATGAGNVPETEVSSGLALVAGGGADYKVSDRFAVRIKADYLQSKTDFSAIGKAKQDNLRLSVGIVLRSVKKKKRHLEDETNLEP